MKRITLISNKRRDINLVFSSSLFVNIVKECDLKSPMPLVVFHVSTGIKLIRLFILFGIGIEYIKFFTDTEAEVMTRLVQSATDYVKHNKGSLTDE